MTGRSLCQNHGQRAKLSILSKYYKIGFYTLIGVLIAFSGYRFYKKDFTYADPIDFRGLYLGSKLIQAELPLYSDSTARAVWLEIKANEQFQSKSDFGDIWVSIMVYPPHAFTLPYVLGYLKWSQARVLWWMICALCFIAILLILYRLGGMNTVLLALAFKGSAFALMLGQPLLLVMLALLLSFTLYQKNPLLAGICLGIAMIKFNLAIPVALFFLLKKQFKLLLSSSITVIAMLLPIYLVYPEIIAEYLDKVGNYYAMIYQPHTENVYTFSDSELSMALDYYIDMSVSFWKRMNALGQTLGYVLFAFLLIKKRISDYIGLMGLLLVSFLFSYHLSYDALILLLPVAMVSDHRIKNAAILLYLLLSLPWNAIFGIGTIISFHYPLIIFLGLILLIFEIFYHARNEASSHTPH